MIHKEFIIITFPGDAWCLRDLVAKKSCIFIFI
jgi:hypothetical protein